MASHRSTAVCVFALGLVLAGTLLVPAVPTAGAAPATPTPQAGMPCVHRVTTFLCGQVPVYRVGPTPTVLAFSYGNPGDLPLFGDWNGDGDRTPAVFRPSTITWYLSDHDDGTGTARALTYGAPGDVPLAGDWTGTGTQTIAVYRPSNATFYLRDTNTSGMADATVPFGNPGDVPLAGDFDNTGTTRIGVYRPSTATFYFTHASGPVTSVAFGNPGDRPLAGSYWCNACACTPIEATYGVFRPGDATWYGLCWSNVMSATSGPFPFGNGDDVPLLK